MSNTVTIKNSETTRAANIIRLSAATSIDHADTQNENIVRFHIFMECFYQNRPDWKGRALALLGHISACLFWEKLLYYRKSLDKGISSGFDYKTESLLAMNDQEQCRVNFQLYLMKAVRSACALNAELGNNIGQRFIKRQIKRSDEAGPYNYSLSDSIKLVHDFDDSFDDNWGGNSALGSIRWDLKLKEHNLEQSKLSNAA